MNAATYPVRQRGLVVPFIALLAFVALGLPLALATEHPAPFDWDPVLMDAPRPSPMPVGFADGNGFHQSLVQLSDGSLQLSFVDVILPVGMEPLVIKRRYRSSLRTEGVFGQGWASNLDVRLIVAGAGTVRIVESDGRVVSYLADTAGHFLPIIGTLPASELSRAGADWVRRWSTGLVEVFDDSGRLGQRIIGNERLELSYADAASRHPATITDAAGHVARLHYRDDLLMEVRYPDNRTIRYEYDQRNLTRVIDTIGRETLFNYAGGKMSEIGLPGGTALRFAYAPDGSLHNVQGPGALTTAFSWDPNPDRPGVTLTALASGVSRSVEIAPAVVNPKVWGIAAKAPQLAMLLRRELPDGEVANAFLLGDKLLLDIAGSRSILDPEAAPEAGAIQGETVDDRHAWRLHFTPAMAPSRDPDIAYDNAGRAVAIRIGEGLRESWKWDDADRIVAWTDVVGSTTNYAYDELDRPIRVSIDGEIAAAVNYDDAGLISHLATADGETDFKYDVVGNLTSVVQPGGTVEFAYDQDGRLVEGRFPGLDPIRLTYDSAGRLVSRSSASAGTQQFTYEDAGRLGSTTEINGKQTRYSYGPQTGRSTVTQQDGRTQTFSSDTDTLQIDTGYPDGGASAIRYNQWGEVEYLRTPDGSEASAKFNAQGFPIAITGNATALNFQYDSDGRLLSEPVAGGERKYTYDNFGRFTRIEAPGAVTTIRYTEDGERIHTVESRGEKTEQTYNALGQLVAETDSTGSITHYRFDSSGRLAGIEAPLSAVHYARDAFGRIETLTQTSPDQTASVRYSYTAAHELASITHEDGTTEQFTYNTNGRVATWIDRLGNSNSYDYDADGRVTTVANPLGNTEYSYDAEGRVATITTPGEAPRGYFYPSPGEITTAEPGGELTQVRLNGRGQLVRRIDALGNTLLREYDELGRLSAVTDPNGDRTTWSYGDGLVVRHSPRGKATTYRYNQDAALTDIADANGIRWHAEYDPTGRMVRTDDGGRKPWLFSYDRQGRLATADGPDGVAAYRRDALGRIVAYTDPFGTQTEVSYDAADRIETIHAAGADPIRYTYNQWGLMATIEAAGAQTTFAYDDVRRLSAITYPNGMEAVYTYDEGRRAKSIEYRNAGGDVLYSEAYGYDSVGNLTAIDTLQGRIAYRYDALHRLIGATYPDGRTEFYKYDPDGHVLSSHDVASWTYDADQQLSEWNGRQIASDDAGNLTHILGGPRYAYDATGRLTSVTTASGTIVTFTYDAEGRRIQKKSGTDIVHYAYVGKELVAAYDRSGKLLISYVPGVQEGMPLALYRNGRPYYPIRSFTGSIMALADASGSIVTRFDYEAYGRVVTAEGEPIIAPVFAGHPLDAETGLYDFGARAYAPDLRRFLSPDPQGADQGGSYYAYGLSNPVQIVDPDGAANSSAGLPSGLPRAVPEVKSVLLPGQDRVVIDELRRIAAAESATPGGQRAAEILRAIDSGEVVPRVYNYDVMKDAKGKLVPNLDAGGGTKFHPKYAPLVPDPKDPTGKPLIPKDLTYTKEANIYRDAMAQPSKSTIERQMAGAAYHEGKHVTQRLGPPDSFRGYYDASIDGYHETIPARRIHEIEPHWGQWEIDNTVRSSQKYDTFTDVIDKKIAPSYGHMPGYYDPKTGSPIREVREVLGRVDPKTGELILNPKRADAIVPEKIWPGLQDEIDKLKSVRQQLGIDQPADLKDLGSGQSLLDREAAAQASRVQEALAEADRALLKKASQLEYPKGPVNRALNTVASKSRAAAGKASTLAKKALDAALSKNSALYDKVGSAAKKAFSFVAKKLGGVGRFANVFIPVAAIKGAVDMAIGIGAAAGETAADIYIAYRKGRDAILSPLDKLARDIEAMEGKDAEVKKKKKARRQELVNALVPDPVQIGQRPGTNAPQPGTPDQPGTSQLPGSSQNAPAPDQAAAKPESGQPLGPDKPLGGAAASPQPGGPPKGKSPTSPVNPPPDRPKDPPPGPEPAAPKAEPVTPPPEPQAPAQPDNAAGDVGGRKVKDWAARCGGSSIGEVAARIPQIVPPSLVPNCLCFGALMGNVPGLSPEAVIDPPAQRDACGAYIASFKKEEPEKIAEAPPPPAVKTDTVEPEPGETTDAAPSQPEATPPKPAEPAPVEPPLDEGLAPPSLPDFTKPRETAPEPLPAPKPVETASAEPERPTPERPTAGEPQKPALYDKGFVNPSGGITPKGSPGGNPASSSGSGTGLAGAYGKVIGWLDYVYRQIK